MTISFTLFLLLLWKLKQRRLGWMDRLDGWVSKVCDFERGDSCLCPVSNCGHYFILTKFFCFVFSPNHCPALTKQFLHLLRNTAICKSGWQWQTTILSFNVEEVLGSWACVSCDPVQGYVNIQCYPTKCTVCVLELYQRCGMHFFQLKNICIFDKDGLWSCTSDYFNFSYFDLDIS